MVRLRGTGRFWEIDFLRGIAIIIMIFFHFLYDLNHFSITNYRLYTGFFSYLAQITAGIFIFLVGVSLTIWYNKSMQKGESELFAKKSVMRGVRIFSLGLIITLITFFYIPDRFVIFGVLHFIGVSLILSIPFVHYRNVNFFVGFLLICIGIYLRMFRFDFSWLLPVGFVPDYFATIDYFPLLPWFGVILIGICVGNYAYKDGVRRFHFKERADMPGIKHVCFLGRNSLYIYFFHQPILISVIYLLML